MFPEPGGGGHLRWGLAAGTSAASAGASSTLGQAAGSAATAGLTQQPAGAPRY